MAVSRLALAPPEEVEFHLNEGQIKAMQDLISPATHNGLGGGSRSGKTFLLLRAIIIRSLKAPGSRHAVFRYRFNAVKNSVVHDTLQKVMSLCFPGLLPQCVMNKTDWFLTLPKTDKSGKQSEIWFAGLDDKERTEKILGMEFSTLFFNECSEIPLSSVNLALTRLAQRSGLVLKAYYDLNPPSKRHWTHKKLIEKIDVESGNKVDDPENYTYFRINPIDNQDNLAPEYLKLLAGLPERTRKRFLLGEFADDDESLLWTDEAFMSSRLLGRSAENMPDMLRIVVGVDPSGASGEEDYRSDEIGIVVGGLGTDGHAYLFEDLSLRDKPAVWGKVAGDAYDRHFADRVVGEKNYGGAMVEHVVRIANPNISYKDVTATRGKHIRAEPAAALYEQGKVHHIGHFPELEEQLTGFTVHGYQGARSPDRADAWIWVLAELFPGMTKRTEQRVKYDDLTIPDTYNVFANQ